MRRSSFLRKIGKNPSLICLDCKDEISEEERDKRLTPFCKHDVTTCVSCSKERIEQHVELEISPGMICWSPNCNEAITGTDVLRVTENDELATQFDIISTSFYLCSICKSDLAPSRFNFKGSLCKHPPTVCDECVLRFLMKRGSPFWKSSCPTANCNETITRKCIEKVCHSNPYLPICDTLKGLLAPLHCVMCGDRKESFAVRQATRNCRHVPVCYICLTKHIRYFIHVRQSKFIPCPHPNCLEFLTTADIARHTNAKTSIMYQKIVINKNIDAPSFEFNICPVPGCTNIQRHLKGTVFMKCQYCGASSCLLCEQKWHPGSLCIKGSSEIGSELDSENQSSETICRTNMIST